jgi:hypothetical protein
MSLAFAFAFCVLTGQDDKLAPSPPPSSTAPFIERLAYWRLEFEDALKDPVPFVYPYAAEAMLNSPPWGEGLYPIGSASERFLVSYEEKGVKLLYERRHGKIATVDWRIPLVESKSLKPAQGTIENYLAQAGYAISPKAHLTARMRRQLSQRGYFAYYYYAMLGGMTYAVVRPDGSKSAAEATQGDPFAKHSRTFPVTAEEQKLLKDRESG